jgi:hypothetical protein
MPTLGAKKSRDFREKQGRLYSTRALASDPLLIQIKNGGTAHGRRIPVESIKREKMAENPPLKLFCHSRTDFIDFSSAL